MDKGQWTIDNEETGVSTLNLSFHVINYQLSIINF